MNVPVQAIQPIRERLAELKAEVKVQAPYQQDETLLAPVRAAIAEMEALIQRLENPHAPRHP